MREIEPLSPNYPAQYLGTLGDAYRQYGRLDEAIAVFEAYHGRSPGFGLTDVVIAYQEKSQPEDAKRTAERLMAARPAFTIAGWRGARSSAATRRGSRPMRRPFEPLDFHWVERRPKLPAVAVEPKRAAAEVARRPKRQVVE